MQVAIVTGASSGIGFGCATKLAEMGMAVVGTGRDKNRLADLEKAIGDADFRSVCIAARREAGVPHHVFVAVLDQVAAEREGQL